MAFCALLYNPDPKSLLVVGLGGGVIPREMRHYYPDLAIDVAEIDACVPGVAERFFHFKPDSRLKVHVADGRVFIRRQLRRKPRPRYDVVILDAFNGDYIPFHLMTKEFLEEVRDVLADDGVVVANVFHSNKLFHAEMKTFLAVFGRCQAFYAPHASNAMLVSPGRSGRVLTKEGALKRAARVQRERKFHFDLREVAKRLRDNVRLPRGVRLLTDDRAPVNRLRNQRTPPRERDKGEQPDAEATREQDVAHDALLTCVER